MTPDELVEKVLSAWGAPEHDELCRQRAVFAIRIALEEAAKVVNLMPRTYDKIKKDHDVLGMSGTWTFTLNNGPSECAAVIRALIPEEKHD